MSYTPTGWAFLRIQVEGCEPVIKVFGSWSGDYLNGDSWRLNSGCIKIEENENEYIVYGYSGSQYILSKTRNYIRPYNKAVLDDMIAELRSYSHKAEIISAQEAINIIGA